jgi:hypothetical protein
MHSEYVILIAFPQQQWLHNCTSMLCYTHTACLFKFSLIFTIKNAQENQEGLKCSGTFQLLVCADDANLLGENINTMKQNTEALLFASKKVGPVGNAVKTKYVFMSH